MTCYDCLTETGRSVPAVAVCTTCGMATCPDHTVLDKRDAAFRGHPGPSTSRVVRVARCTQCHAVVHPELSTVR